MDPDYAPGIKAEDKKQGGRVKMRQTGMGTKSKHEAALAEHIASKSPLIASFGRKAPGCSNLSLFLQKPEAHLNGFHSSGIDSVWECRGICLETFFLCESCEETIPRRDVCQHMASFNHQLKYMCKNHPEFLELFWLDEDLPKALKINILHEVVWRLAERDRMFRKDAKCITLEKKLHRFVRTAQFNEALKTVWILVHEEPMIPLPFSNAQQFNAEENAKSTVEQEISFIGTSKIARDFIPVELNSVSKTDQVGGSVPNPGVYTKPDFFLKPGMKSSIPEAQKLVPESKFLPAVKKTLKVSVRGPSRKRPADSAVETLHKTNGSLNDPLPDKCTLGQRESNSPALVSPAVNVAAGSSLLAVKAEDFKPEQGD